MIKKKVSNLNEYLETFSSKKPKYANCLTEEDN